MLAPIAIKIFPIKSININVIKTPAAIPAHIQNEAKLSACFLFPAPSAREMQDIPPAIKTIPIVINIMKTGPASDTAAI